MYSVLPAAKGDRDGGTERKREESQRVKGERTVFIYIKEIRPGSLYMYIWDGHRDWTLYLVEVPVVSKFALYKLGWPYLRGNPVFKRGQET